MNGLRRALKGDEGATLPSNSQLLRKGLGFNVVHTLPRGAGASLRYAGTLSPLSPLTSGLRRV